MAVPEDAPSAASGSTSRPKRWWLFVLAVLFVIYLIPTVLTSSPKACASCHAMKPYYASWQLSSHRATAPNCLYCHVRPGVANLVVYRLLFYREIVASVAGWQLKPIGAAAPSTESCTRAGCHSKNRQVSTSGNLRINHGLHVTQAGVSCAKCHPGAVHQGVDGRLLLPPMKICKECHAAKMNDCSYCHIGEIRGSPSGH